MKPWSYRPRISPAKLVWVLAVVAIAGWLSLVVRLHESDWVQADEVGLVSSTAETQSPAPCEGIAGIPFGTDRAGCAWAEASIRTRRSSRSAARSSGHT